MSVTEYDFNESNSRFETALDLSRMQAIAAELSLAADSPVASDKSDFDWHVEVNKEETKWDSWHNYKKVVKNGKTYAKVGNRLYSKHAVDRMQPSGNRFGPNIYQGLNGDVYGRSVAPQYVEEIIKSSKPVCQPKTGNYMYGNNTIEVILNPEGAVVTIMTYKR